MTRTEHLLTCLSEECAEVAQRASKAMRFGIHDKQDGQALTNSERIVQELNDLIAVVDMLVEEQALPELYMSLPEIRAKKARVEKFLKYSKQQGTLTRTKKAKSKE